MLALRFSNLFRRASIFVVHCRTNTTRLELDQLLERLDGEAHRRGRLNPGLVRGAMQKAAQDLSSINPTQALLLIRCTGSLLVSELPRQRQQVLDHMMKIFKTKNVPFDVTHYNSYMRVSLQNQSFFNPTEILHEMKRSNIQPNLTSFRLLIECYARQGQSNEIQQILNEMKSAHLNIEPLVLTHLLSSYAQKGNIEQLEHLYKLFNELELKPISETYEQFILAYLKRGEMIRAKKYFVENVSKMDNDSLFRLLIKSAQCQQKDLFESIISSIDKNSLADICVQYILCATELLDNRSDEYAFLLVESFPKRDETLRFDLINITLLNLLKLRLPIEHFRSFSTDNIDHIESNLSFKCERQPVTNKQRNHFRQLVLQRAETFIEPKDRWLAIHQLLHHAYQNYLPMPYIYTIYDSMHRLNYDYRPHFIRPILIKFQRIYQENTVEMTNQIQILLDYLQKNFSINFDPETIDLLIDYFFEQCFLKSTDIDTILKKANINPNIYWTNLYTQTFKRINIELLNSLKVFLNLNKTIRFEYNPLIREHTIQGIQSLINQLSLNYEKQNTDEIFQHLKDIIDFIDIVNKRFVKNPSDIINLNDCVLISIVNWFLDKNHQQSIDLMKNILQIFEQRSQTITLTEPIREKIYRQLGIKSESEINDQLIRSLKRDQEKCITILSSSSSSSPDNQSSSDDDNHVYIKSSKSTRHFTIREMEDHLIELKHKRMNTSGIISKLLAKYCSECLDGERKLTDLVKENYMKRIIELEAIYFDKNQTSGFPSLGVIAMLIDYYSRIELNLDKVVFYTNLSNELDPNFKLDPHKCVSVIRLLIRKNSFDKAMELIDSLGRYDIVPNYMYRRVRDLLIDSYLLLNFEQFERLVQKLFENNYVEPSSIVLSLIVRKSYHDHGPLRAFETIKNLLVKFNNLVGMFPIVRKLLRDDCTEELKHVLIKIGKIRTRTYAYEQLAFALIHERRLTEAMKVCQHLSRSTFEEHCQRYVRELFYFPKSDLSINKDIYETNYVFDNETISLIHFIDFIEQYPSQTRQLSIDTLFYSLFKAYEKMNRLDEFTRIMRDYSSKYMKYFSSKTKDALSQAGISLPIKSLSSPKQTKKRSTKHERFLHDQDYEDDTQNQPNIF